MMTSTQIRQSFLDFFRSKQHTIVPSSSLMPDSPDIAFTNAGMNQFVPIFLNDTKCPYTPGRAADTQKCIRAGGKHNDLDDVGLDTYHHTFFEMLGNWSFGDYFKQEAISWAWELVIEVWKFPPQRLYATVYCPHMDLAVWQQELKFLALNYLNQSTIKGGDYQDKFRNGEVSGKPSIGDILREGSDMEAAQHWFRLFKEAGLDPAVHIVPGNKKDNFWMMGESGPCGPCSELHVDLTPLGDTQGSLVNKGDARCIEIWNNVFIQFNAVIVRTEMKEIHPGIFKEVPAETRFDPLPAKHVDTGMGFERVTSIMQGTKGLTDFANAKISNYETDIFRPIFDELEKMSGKKYGSTLPKSGSTGDTEQEKVDIAFRVIGDHIRTLSFAIADGIQPGNTDRNYVLRRILRRAVRYGRTLGFHEPFFYKLVDVLAATMGDVFPEIRTRKQHVKDVLKLEEEAFNKTLDTGLELLKLKMIPGIIDLCMEKPKRDKSQPHRDDYFVEFFEDSANNPKPFTTERWGSPSEKEHYQFDLVHCSAIDFEKQFGRLPLLFGEAAFVLYDTYGFPLDLTQLIGRERGFDVDTVGFTKLMEEQKARARAAQKKTVIELSQIETKTPTRFLGYDALETPARVLEVVGLKDKTAVVLDTSTCYAEMGGQLGDTGEFTGSGQLWRVVNTQKSGNTWLHFVEGGDAPAVGATVTLTVEKARRDAIQRHHTVTHLLHWALHEVVSREASQKGSFVGPDKLTFDFNSAALTPAQVADIEKLVNERIVENAGVSWTEVPHADVKARKDVMQFFGDKYGDTVRVVQIGGGANKLDGYSMELCGGTHTRATGEIGLFRIVGENAIAAGVRRIEAIAGLTAFDAMRLDRELIRTVAGKVSSPIHELEKKIEAVLAQQKELEKQLKIAVARNASNAASELLSRAQTVNGTPLITHNLGDADGEFLQAVVDALKSRFKGVIVLGGGAGGAVTLIASVSADFTTKAQAGKIIQAIAPIVGGKGGGKPDNARGGGKDASKLDEALAKVKGLLG